MNASDPAAYGDLIADVYDDWFATGAYDNQEAENAAEFLIVLAAGGRALEMGVGTGRVALPLARRGIEVHGVEASASMVAKLRAKPGGASVAVTIGNIAQTTAPGSFDLVYAVFNTLYFLTTQDEQVRCIANVRRHLRPGGHFVVQGFMPNPARLQSGGHVHVDEVGGHHVRLSVTRHDHVTQTLHTQCVVLASDSVRLFPVRMRYVWPPELDLMCRVNGLRPVERVGEWDRSPLTTASSRYVAVYELDEPHAWADREDSSAARA